MFCKKCGARLEPVEQFDNLSNYGIVEHNRHTGELMRYVSEYLVCPNKHWWSSHDKLFQGVRITS